MVDIDRDRALALGVTPQQIQNALFTAFSQRQVSIIYAPANQYSVILEVQPEVSAQPGRAFRSCTSARRRRQLVPLDDVVQTVARTVGPLSVNHFGQLPAATISFNLQPGFSLGEAAQAVDDAIRELRMPATHHAELPGNGEGVPGVVSGPDGPADRGDSGDLHRAGHSV